VTRNICLAAVLGLLLPAVSSAQDWAEKMFREQRHDFGTVARGADVEYRFEIQNIYEETVHIAGVRTSCGCTTPSLENQTLKTWEKGYVVARFNTRTFRGQHGATLTVTIDQPYRAEVQLRVEGNIRGDVVFHPGSIRFANADQGTAHQQKVRVSYAGRSDWKITDIRSANEHFQVEMTEVRREAGRVDYDLNVRLAPDAPPGYFSDQLIIVTNDRNSSRIPLDVEGTIVPEISVSPNQLVLGEVQPGQEVTKRLVVKGKQPFRITSVKCEDGSFKFDAGGESKRIHVVTVTFRPDQDAAGKVQQLIRIATDRGDNIGATLDAYAEVVSTQKTTDKAASDSRAENPDPDQQAVVRQ
jgi:hypothetical protein